MPRISVYHEDPIRYYCDMEPDVTAAAQRRVTENEFAEIQVLQAHYARLQELLAEIRERPELEWEDIDAEEKAERS